MSIRVFVRYNGKDILTYDTSVAPIQIKYGDTLIHSLPNDSSVTLNCEGKYSEYDITTSYVNGSVAGTAKKLNCAKKRFHTDIVITSEDNGIDPVLVIGDNGNSSNCYVTVNGTKYYTANSISVVRGTAVTCGVRGYNSTYPGTVTVNGNVVYTNTRNSTQTYTYTVPKGMKNIYFNFVSNTYESGKSTYNYYTIDIVEESY